MDQLRKWSEERKEAVAKKAMSKRKEDYMRAALARDSDEALKIFAETAEDYLAKRCKNVHSFREDECRGRCRVPEYEEVRTSAPIATSGDANGKVKSKQDVPVTGALEKIESLKKGLRPIVLDAKAGEGEEDSI